MSEQDSPRKDNQPSNDASEANTSTSSIAQLVLLYIGIPGATLYPLGLLALLIQILRDPSFPFLDPVTAWGAVSVIPQTIVIWTGIWLVFLSLFTAFVGMEVYYLTLLLLRQWQKRYKRSGRSSENSSDRGEIRRTLRWSLYLLPLLPVAMLVSWNMSGGNFDRSADIEILLGFLLFSLGGEALAGYIREHRYHRGSYGSLVVGYVGTLLAALCLSALSDPARATPGRDRHGRSRWAAGLFRSLR